MTHETAAHEVSAMATMHVELRTGKRKAAWVRLTGATLTERYEEASNLVQGYITVGGLGASEFTGGAIREDADKVDGGRVIAHVSYNGRVWGPEGWKQGARPIFDPFAPFVSVA